MHVQGGIPSGLFSYDDMLGSAHGAMEAMHFLHKLFNRCERRVRQYLRDILLEVTGFAVKEKSLTLFWHLQPLFNFQAPTPRTPELEGAD